jgi:hypothetical protein
VESFLIDHEHRLALLPRRSAGRAIHKGQRALYREREKQ